MDHSPDLIRDLALIIMTGATTTLIFKRIKQPLASQIAVFKPVFDVTHLKDINGTDVDINEIVF